jgi:hypothetical protein
MNDIVSIFPTAEDFRNTSIEQYSLYLFEQELNSVLRLIIWGKSKGFKKIQTDSLSEMTNEFLTEKGYKITKENNFYWIEWGE